MVDFVIFCQGSKDREYIKNIKLIKTLSRNKWIFRDIFVKDFGFLDCKDTIKKKNR